MRLTTRSLLGLSSVAAILVTAGVGGTALASHGADDAQTGTRVGDDRGGLTNRDQRNEMGDDRRVNGTSAPTVSPTAVPTTRATTRSARPTSSSTHDAGDDHGRRHGGRGTDDPTRQHAAPTVSATDDSGHHAAGTDHRRHTGTDDSGHHAAGADDTRHTGSDERGHHRGGDDHGGKHGGHGSDD